MKAISEGLRSPNAQQSQIQSLYTKPLCGLTICNQPAQNEGPFSTENIPDNMVLPKNPLLTKKQNILTKLDVNVRNLEALSVYSDQRKPQ